MSMSSSNKALTAVAGWTARLRPSSREVVPNPFLLRKSGVWIAPAATITVSVSMRRRPPPVVRALTARALRLRVSMWVAVAPV
jgi:hypothetical protein